jgi:hypothetical protein
VSIGGWPDRGAAIGGFPEAAERPRRSAEVV